MWGVAATRVIPTAVNALASSRLPSMSAGPSSSPGRMCEWRSIKESGEPARERVVALPRAGNGWLPYRGGAEEPDSGAVQRQALSQIIRGTHLEAQGRRLRVGRPVVVGRSDQRVPVVCVVELYLGA